MRLCREGHCCLPIYHYIICLRSFYKQLHFLIDPRFAIEIPKISIKAAMKLLKKFNSINRTKILDGEQYYLKLECHCRNHHTKVKSGWDGSRGNLILVKPEAHGRGINNSGTYKKHVSLSINAFFDNLIILFSTVFSYSSMILSPYAKFQSSSLLHDT